MRKEGSRRILNPIKSYPSESGMKWKENFNMIKKKGHFGSSSMSTAFPPNLPNSLERNSSSSLLFPSLLFPSPSLKLSFVFSFSFSFFSPFSKLTNYALALNLRCGERWLLSMYCLTLTEVKEDLQPPFLKSILVYRIWGILMVVVWIKIDGSIMAYVELGLLIIV